MGTALNTGTSGVLKAHNGNFQSSSNGQVIRDLDIFGWVTITHDNVTIENCRVRGGVATSSRGLINSTGLGNKIYHCELVPDGPSQWIEGIVGENYTAKWNKIRDVVDYFRVAANCKIWNNYCRDLTYFTPCDYQSDNQTHNDAVQMNPGATNWDIQWNDFGAKYGPRGSHQPSHFQGPTPAGQTYPDCSVLMFGSSLVANGFPGGGKFNNNVCRGGFQPINGGADSLADQNLGQFHKNQFDGDSFGGPGMTSSTRTLDFNAGVIKDDGAGTANANTFLDGTEVLVRNNQ